MSIRAGSIYLRGFERVQRGGSTAALIQEWRLDCQRAVAPGGHYGPPLGELPAGCVVNSSARPIAEKLRCNLMRFQRARISVLLKDIFTREQVMDEELAGFIARLGLLDGLGAKLGSLS